MSNPYLIINPDMDLDNYREVTEGDCPVSVLVVNRCTNECVGLNMATKLKKKTGFTHPFPPRIDGLTYELQTTPKHLIYLLTTITL